MTATASWRPSPTSRTRGIRYRLASLLTVAVCAVVAGAVTFAAIADWLEDLPDTDLPALRLTRRPVATTLWRLLIRVDSVALTRVLAGWLLTRVPPTDVPDNEQAAPAPVRRMAIDGKTVRGTVRPDGTYTHLLSADDVATGITVAQIPLEAEGGKIAQVKPLVEQVEAVVGSVAGTIFVADARHPQTLHTQDLTARDAALLVQVKANQRGLFRRAAAALAEDPGRGPYQRPRARPPGDPHRQGGHRRRSRWPGLPARRASRADHPHPPRGRRDHTRDRRPDRHPAPRPGLTGRSERMGAPRVAHREPKSLGERHDAA